MKHLRSLLALAIIAISSVQSLAQLSKQYANYSQHKYKSLRYGLFTPDNYDPTKSYPLVVYLHGSRDTVSRDLQWYKAYFQSSNPVFVLTPKCEEPNLGWGNTWQEGHTAATTKMLSLVDSLVRKYTIDKNRLYLYGISMGGFGVFSVLVKETGKFAAAYSVCGGSDVKAAPRLLATPLWIFHGSDDDIVPVALSRDVYKELIRLGGQNVKYTEYPGVKHNSWENVAREKSLTTWLLAQRKNQNK